MGFTIQRMGRKFQYNKVVKIKVSQIRRLPVAFPSRLQCAKCTEVKLL